MIKMNTNKLLSAVFLSVLLFTACKEEQGLSPLDSDGTAPGPVTNVTVENLPGGAQINYDVPDDPDLLYVKAVYQTNPQTTREAKASRHNNHLIIEGFGHTGEYEVTLYAVNQSENESEPVTITIEPLTPFVLKVFESLVTLADFGGINVAFQNEDEADIVIAVITTDHAGDWQPVDNFYTARRDGEYVARGFEAEPRTFGVYVRDRWENHSDTLITEITPLYEEELDKALFAAIALENDTHYENPPASSLSIMWNGDTVQATTASYYNSGRCCPLPITFTIDLGATVQLSRMKMWPRYRDHNDRPYEYIFNSFNPFRFEIWGSNDPHPDGRWEDWELLESFESVKPSGLPLGEINDEDVQAALAGEDFIFPIDSPAVRFIRWRVIDLWTAREGTEAPVTITEISLWGQYEN